MSDATVKRDGIGVPTSDKMEGRDASTGRFTAGNKGGGRPRIDPAVRDLIRDATPRAFQKLIDQLEATRTIVVGHGDSAHEVEVADNDIQHRAAALLAAYGVGKPTEKVSLEDPDGNPMQLGVILLPAQRAE